MFLPLRGSGHHTGALEHLASKFSFLLFLSVCFILRHGFLFRALAVLELTLWAMLASELKVPAASASGVLGSKVHATTTTQLFLGLFCFVVFFKQDFCYGWPWTHHVGDGDLEFLIFQLLPPKSWSTVKHYHAWFLKYKTSNACWESALLTQPRPQFSFYIPQTVGSGFTAGLPEAKVTE